MSENLRTRTLAEIERREDCEHCGHRKVEHFGEWCRAVTGAVTADGGTRICGCEGASHDDPALAYLAVLRKVVELHHPVGCFDPAHPHDYACDECLDECPCPTVVAVAEGLGVAP